MNTQLLTPIRFGLIMGIAALIFGALWAAYIATHHEQLHGGFEAQQENMQQTQIHEMMQGLSMDDMDMHHADETNMPANHHQQNSAHRHAGGHEVEAHKTSAQHSHSGSLATDAMQRLIRGHIHAMGLGVLVCVLLLVVAFTGLKDGWKKVLGYSFGLGALAYPPAWIIMGFRTVELGPEAAEASIMWLFAPAVGLLLVSMVAVFLVLVIELLQAQNNKVFSFLFVQDVA